MRSVLTRWSAVLVLAMLVQGCASTSRRAQAAAVPSGWPVSRSSATVTAEFGVPRGVSHHEGIDLAAPAGTPVRATAGGTVIVAGKRGHYGKTVIIDHGGGFRSLYAHLKKIETKKEKRVKRGDLIGRVGRSGNASGTHLHYEVLQDGVPVNPRPFLDG